MADQMADQMFENTILKTIANPKLSSIKKRLLLRDLVGVANTDFQKGVAEAYYEFSKALLSGDKPAFRLPQSLSEVWNDPRCIKMFLQALKAY